MSDLDKGEQRGGKAWDQSQIIEGYHWLTCAGRSRSHPTAEQEMPRRSEMGSRRIVWQTVLHAVENSWKLLRPSGSRPPFLKMGMIEAVLRLWEPYQS